MNNIARLGSFLFVSLVLVAPITAARRLDGGGWPIVVLPADDTIEAGEGTSVTVQMNKIQDSPTVVQITSSHPDLLPVPSTITVPFCIAPNTPLSPSRTF